MTYTNTSTAVRWEPWTYRDQSWMGSDLTGYKIDAIDGEIGKVDEATSEVSGSYLVVDTGPWIFGRKVMLPAGVVSGVDHQNKRVFVERMKEHIERAPEFDEAKLVDTTYSDTFRDRLGTYYGEDGPGWYSPR